MASSSKEYLPQRAQVEPVIILGGDQKRCHGVDCMVDISSPLLPQVVPELDADLVSFYWRWRGEEYVWSLTRQSATFRERSEFIASVGY